MTRYLRSCAVGGGHHLGHNSRSFGGRYFCPKHLREIFAGFDPQPYPARDRTVRLIDGPDTSMCVLARDGDRLTLRPLGRPDAPEVTATVQTVWPDRYGKHTRGCGQ